MMQCLVHGKASKHLKQRLHRLSINLHFCHWKKDNYLELAFIPKVLSVLSPAVEWGNAELGGIIGKESAPPL